MEKVSIQEASRRLHIPTSSIRQCIQSGELKAERAPGPDGRTGWVVEMPPEGWTNSATAQEQNRYPLLPGGGETGKGRARFIMWRTFIPLPLRKLCLDSSADTREQTFGRL